MNQESLPLENLRIFLDEDTSGRILTESLEGLGAEVILLRNVLQRGTDDVSWLRWCAEHEVSAAITRDSRARQNPIFRELVASEGARVFVIRGSGLNGAALGERIERHARKIANRIASIDDGFIAHVTEQSVMTVYSSIRG